MKIIFNLLALFIIIGITFLARENAQTMVDFSTIGIGALHAKIYHIKLIYVMQLGLIAGALAGICFMVPGVYTSEAKLKEYKRKLEKTSVQSSCDSSKVDVLEAKIQVLEKALKSALEQKND